MKHPSWIEKQLAIKLKLFVLSKRCSKCFSSLVMSQVLVVDNSIIPSSKRNAVINQRPISISSLIQEKRNFIDKHDEAYASDINRKIFRQTLPRKSAKSLSCIFHCEMCGLSKIALEIGL